MAERHSTSSASAAVPDGSVVPARLRIVGWMVTASALGLLAVVLTVRSALSADVEEAANAGVVQEVDEFRTFADRLQDPDTGDPVTDPGRLLALYLQGQFPGRGEVLLGYDRGIDPAAASPLLVQQVEDPSGLTEDTALVQELVDSVATSGTATTASGELRWARVDVEGGAGGALLIAQSLEPARAEVADTVRLLALVCLGGLLLTGVIAFAVAGQVLAPVRAVRRAASRTTRADLGRRIEVRGRDDVAALALTHNAMLDRLEGSFRAQQGFARSANRVLRASLARLADPALPGPERVATAAAVREVLDDLDVLARSHAPDFVVATDVDAAALTDRLVADVTALDPDRRWAVEERGTGTVRVDEARLARAVRALAVNALSQAPPAPGRDGLRIGTRTGSDHLEVWVADDGPGLAPERAAHVLDRYDDPAPDEDPGPGPGLGLAVVRAVADAHGGSAWVETAPGEGATFGLLLPLAGPVDGPGEGSRARSGAGPRSGAQA